MKRCILNKWCLNAVMSNAEPFLIDRSVILVGSQLHAVLNTIGSNVLKAFLTKNLKFGQWMNKVAKNFLVLNSL